MRKIIFAASAFAALVNSTYIVTCHNDSECGTVCGNYGSDTISPSEGLFGTKCSCQKGSPTYRCSQSGKSVYVCSDYQPPRCSAACNQKVCIHMPNGRQSTGVIRSACPRNHPVNTEQCCKYGGSYCTCVFQDTIDVNYKVYNELGGQNGYSDRATLGGCGWADTGIDIRSKEALSYAKLKGVQFCSYENSNLGDNYHKNLVENNKAMGINTDLKYPHENQSEEHHHHHHE
jgi:hypothetical protein